jgi:thioredoxin 1
MKRVMEVTDQSFEQSVLKAGVPVLVDFWSPWSERRESVTKSLELLADRFQDKLRIAMVNVEENRDITRALRIAVFPTLALFMGDKVIDMRAGALPEPQVEALVEKALVPAA